MAGHVGDLGEFGLIDRLRAHLPGADGVEIGPGDDAAVLQGSGRPLLGTADLLLEGAHFDLAFSSLSDVGFKSIAVNASDIAAMGGRPRWALISLGVHGAMGVDAVDELYAGVAEAARAYGVAIVGGDTIRSDRLIVSVAMIGEAEFTPVLRSGARPGDRLVVTGPVGAAASGLALLRAAAGDHDARALLEKFPDLARAHRRGRARIDEGQTLARAGAHAMIDVSDGLAADVAHICTASGVGVTLDTVPLADGVREVAGWLGEDPVTFALGGGDDYELAAAVEGEMFTVVGRFTAGDGVHRADGGEIPLGWDHLA